MFFGFFFGVLITGRGFVSLCPASGPRCPGDVPPHWVILLFCRAVGTVSPLSPSFPPYQGAQTHHHHAAGSLERHLLQEGVSHGRHGKKLRIFARLGFFDATFDAAAPQWDEHQDKPSSEGGSAPGQVPFWGRQRGLVLLALVGATRMSPPPSHQPQTHRWHHRG